MSYVLRRTKRASMVEYQETLDEWRRVEEAVMDPEDLPKTAPEPAREKVKVPRRPKTCRKKKKKKKKVLTQSFWDNVTTLFTESEVSRTPLNEWGTMVQEHRVPPSIGPSIGPPSIGSPVAPPVVHKTHRSPVVVPKVIIEEGEPVETELEVVARGLESPRPPSAPRMARVVVVRPRVELRRHVKPRSDFAAVYGKVAEASYYRAWSYGLQRPRLPKRRPIKLAPHYEPRPVKRPVIAKPPRRDLEDAKKRLAGRPLLPKVSIAGRHAQRATNAVAQASLWKALKGKKFWSPDTSMPRVGPDPFTVLCLGQGAQDGVVNVDSGLACIKTCAKLLASHCRIDLVLLGAVHDMPVRQLIEALRTMLATTTPIVGYSTDEEGLSDFVEARDLPTYLATFK